LGANWVNIAHSIPGSEAIDARDLEGRSVGPFAKPLVRLAQDYSVEELPLGDNDAAIAAELVFCLWVRRRDPHAWNRAYVRGVPVFFDQHVAFDDRSLEDFFETGDASHPPHWRVCEFPHDYVPTTLAERDTYRTFDQQSGISIQRVHDIGAFEAAFATAIATIIDLSDDWLAQQAQLANAPVPLTDQLIRTRRELPIAADRLRQTLFET
jgi:hypothetical protein